MRRALLAVLSAIVTTAALIGGKFITTPNSAGHTVAEVPPPKATTNSGEPSASGSAVPSKSASPSASQTKAPGTTPPPTTPQGTTPPGTTPPGTTPPGTTPPPTSPEPTSPSPTPPPSSSPPTTPPPTSPTPTCDTYDGDSVSIGGDGGDGIVFITITVCNGVLTEAGGGVMMSNYEPQNTDAVAALNVLAVKYYKTDFSMITYSGATLTSAAYQASLKSAMALAGMSPTHQ
jgi:hypothetical protein